MAALECGAAPLVVTLTKQGNACHAVGGVSRRNRPQLSQVKLEDVNSVGSQENMKSKEYPVHIGEHLCLS